MRFLIVGLGSMGKRRARNLLALGFNNITGYDNNPKRLLEFEKKYKLKTIKFFKNINRDNYDAIIVSTNPSYHFKYIKHAIKYKLNCFIEASIVNENLIKHEMKKISDKTIVYAPSCTMRYYQMPKVVKSLINKRYIGKPLYINYHTGQYLPDWHPWENIKDFYVSNKKTGGCREIVPFELNWLNDIFGFPKKVSNSFKAKISKINANIDDIYNFLLIYKTNIIAQITIEVLSRPSHTRNLNIVGTKGKISFDSDKNVVVLKSLTKNQKISLIKQKTEKNYINPEQPYINEMNDFIKAIKSKNKKPFPSNFNEDIKLLKLLKEIEKKSKINEL
tara:strand:+ start:618 stop:1616 length:999 start_codon:yes stop_codon:yes gene_type:complete